MITWINFLHLYQPPHQNVYIFDKIINESYRRFLKFINSSSNVNFTLNVSGSLLEQIRFYGKNDVIEEIKKAVQDGKIELAGSAMFHPILPLLNEFEILRQIELNNKINKECFGDLYSPKGFYMSEMAYSKNAVSVVKKMGFEWIILDEISFNGALESVDCERVYEIENIGPKVIFRDRKISNTYVPAKINEIAKEIGSVNKTIITATDGELYGHHHIDFEGRLGENFSNNMIKRIKISDYVASFNEFQKTNPIDSCWESSEEDLKNGIPYSFWSDPKNKIQKLIWQLVYFSMETVEENKSDINYEIARHLLDRSLTSDTFWSASGKQSFIWKDVIWNPDMIESGALNMIRSVRSLKMLDTEKRMKAEEMYIDIEKNIWKRHWEEQY